VETLTIVLKIQLHPPYPYHRKDQGDAYEASLGHQRYIVGDILGGPKTAERMEFELFSRLGAQMEVY